MVDVYELKQDFKSNMSIQEVCEKHKISFTEAVNLIKLPVKHKRKQFNKDTNGEMYIQKVYMKFYIRKKVNGKLESFEGYKTLEDAVKVRDLLIKYNWDRSKLKQIKKEVGVL